MSVARVLRLLKEQFGVEDIDFKLREGGGGRFYAYRECRLEVEEFASGVYFGTLERDGLRLSVEGCYLVGKSARKGVVKVGREQAERWMRGENIEGEGDGYVILRWGNYFLGCGKAREGKVLNYLPKERRVP
ncbi:methyltransferase RsmF C-terminal domain-like protein [Candidatus Pyrohabitans sp.]